MAGILYSVGWNSGSRKFTVRETRSFGWRTKIVDMENHDTFRAAYDAARTRYDALVEAQGDVVKMAPEIDCCKALRRSWGMSTIQKEEIASYLKNAKQYTSETSQQGREEAPNEGHIPESFAHENTAPVFPGDLCDLHNGNNILPVPFDLGAGNALMSGTYLSFDRPPMPTPSSSLRPSLANQIQAANERQALKAESSLGKNLTKTNFPHR